MRPVQWRFLLPVQLQWRSSRRHLSWPTLRRALLHLIEHVSQSLLHFQRLLDLISCDVRVFAILHEARAMVVANKLYECWNVGLPIFWKAFKIFKSGRHSGFREKSDGIIGVFIKIGIEYALVHEILITADIEQDPLQVVEFQRCEEERIRFHRLV